MKSRIHSLAISLIFLSIILFLSCKEENGVEPALPYTYQVPEKTNDGWETANLTDVGISSKKLYEVVDLININILKEVHSILIIKNGKLVFEEYFQGHKFDFSGSNHHGNVVNFSMNTIHNQASVTKSFTSALVGLAIDKGNISSVNEKVYDYFPEYSELRDEQKDKMTIEHLLSMTSGFEWNEGEYQYSDNRNDLIQMWNVSDPLRHLMSKSLVAEPGTQFYYNSGCTILLGEIVKRATGTNADMFSKVFLFQPLGISQFQWIHFSNGVLFASGDLQVRPRDMAKLGYLFLNDGKWQGKQVLSSSWIQKSAESYINVNSIWKYGYQWWIRSYTINSQIIDSYSARGWGGQTIIVFPSLNVVMVLTGGNYTTYEPVNDVLQLYLIPSVL